MCAVGVGGSGDESSGFHAAFSFDGIEPDDLHDIAIPVLIPHDKADFNNNGPFSTDYIGHSWSYPDASYAEKKAIWEDHLEYVQSFFYFLSHDPGVPPGLRQEVNE